MFTEHAHVYEQDACIDDEHAKFYNERLKETRKRGVKAPSVHAGTVRVFYAGTRWDVVLVNKENEN